MPVLSVSPQVTEAIKPVVGCHYFTPGPRLPPQPLSINVHGQYQIILLGDRGTCVNNLPRIGLGSTVASTWTCDLLIASPSPETPSGLDWT